uniref:VWFA domain-containing protein n=1 Tax=Globisporangium ultimum (strain ATCC 200006 / CBS 805.95 / DAOM BR144) TaxID=431595 RepID=K3WRM7_GLOUD
MGCAPSSSAGAFNPNASSTDLNRAIPDRYETFAELQDALRRQGLESSNLIIGIDYTKSNTSVIAIIGRTLQPFDDDNLIPAFGFGDATTGDKGVFSFFPDGKPCRGFDEVLARYDEITPQIKLAGPTNFAPIIYEAIRQVKATHAYHILVIIADGQITSEKETAQAIVEASKYALSIIVVGVGDGPWDLMEHYDDTLPSRKFDNFQFVDFNRVMKLNPVKPDVGFATAALMEIPEQYKLIRQLKYLE